MKVFRMAAPRVPDSWLDALRKMTLEEVWKPIFVEGYENQFVAMQSLYPEFKANGDLNCKLIGRAVTASYEDAFDRYAWQQCRRVFLL